MPTLEDKLIQFRDNLTLPASVAVHMTQLIAKLAPTLQKKLPMGQAVKIGSFERKTALPPLKDVDLMLVLNQWSFPAGGQPAEVLDEVKRQLEAALGRPCRRQEHSVGVDYEGFMVDVVPALPEGNAYRIPEVEGNQQRWIRTNPPAHGKYTAEADQRLDARGIPVVKMMKKWKRNKQIPLRSFYMEMMVLRALPTWPGSYAEALRLAFVGVAQLVRSGCPDPGLPKEQLADYASPQLRESIANACQNAAGAMAQAIELERNGYSVKAVEVARSVLGDGFPG